MYSEKSHSKHLRYISNNIWQENINTSFQIIILDISSTHFLKMGAIFI